MERRSSENHGVHEVHKMGGVMSKEMAPLISVLQYSAILYIFSNKNIYVVTYVTAHPWPPVLWLVERSSKKQKSRSTRSTENGWRLTGKCGVIARGRVVGGEESSENHGVYGVQKMGGAIPANMTPLCHCQGPCGGGEESSENHGVHGVQKTGGVIPANVASLSGAVWW